MVESLPFDLWVCDAEGRYVLQNSASRRHWGDQAGRRPEEVGLPPELLAGWLARNRRALAGETVRAEAGYGAGAGTVRVETTLAPIRTGGRVTGYVGVDVDVTERRRAEAALREAEAFRSAAVERERRRLQAVVEGIAEAVVAVFPGEGVWLRNPAWLPLHGFASFDELPGRDVAAFAHLFETRLPDGSPVPRHDLPITRVLRGETFSDVEVRLGRTDKEHERWVSYNGAAVRDPDGSVALAILTMRDITAREEAEERQKLLLAELSHRVKNTLAVVQGIARQSLSGGAHGRSGARGAGDALARARAGPRPAHRERVAGRLLARARGGRARALPRPDLDRGQRAGPGAEGGADAQPRAARAGDERGQVRGVVGARRHGRGRLVGGPSGRG